MDSYQSGRKYPYRSMFYQWMQSRGQVVATHWDLVVDKRTVECLYNYPQDPGFVTWSWILLDPVLFSFVCLSGRFAWSSCVCVGHPQH